MPHATPPSRPRRRRRHGLTVTLLVVTPTAANAHGYVSGDVVARAAAPQNLDRGAVAYEPQSLEAPKGFPDAGPADGTLASAGGLFGGNLDEQSEDRWWKNPVSTGELTLDWTFTAPHRTSEFRYYLTTRDWDPNDPLERSDFELLAVVPHDGSAASTNPSHTVTIPDDYSGYHVIYAVWDIADTSNAFYNTIDLDITGDGAPVDPDPVDPDPVDPGPVDPGPVDAVGHLHVMARTDTTAQLMWTASDDAVSYRISRTAPDGTFTSAQTTATVFDDTGLQPETTYTWTVWAVDAAGELSDPVEVVATTSATVVDPVDPVDPVPTDAAAWDPSAAYVRGDRVLHEGVVYEAVQSHRGVGDPNWIAAPSLWTPVGSAPAPEPTPDPESTPDPEPTPDPGSDASAWNPRGTYAAGDVVTWQGATYVAVQAHTGNGDEGWITAPSLWRRA